VKNCDDIRPLIAQQHEGELSPDEAIELARHMPKCTACRIVDARERRLAEMLSGELQDLPVGDDFVSTVMDTLPIDIPRCRRAKLKLAARVS